MTGLAVGLPVEHHGGTGDPSGKVVGSGAHCAELTMTRWRSLAARRRSVGEALPPVAPVASRGRRDLTRRLRGGVGMVGRCGSGEPWKAVVAGMISTESGEGRGWSSHWRGREAKGRKGARERWSGATACKGKGKGAQGMAALAKGGWCWGEKGRGGPVLGAPRGGGAGGA
jgi:hypothetical protein